MAIRATRRSDPVQDEAVAVVGVIVGVLLLGLGGLALSEGMRWVGIGIGLLAVLSFAPSIQFFGAGRTIQSAGVAAGVLAQAVLVLTTAASTLAVLVSFLSS